MILSTAHGRWWSRFAHFGLSVACVCYALACSPSRQAQGSATPPPYRPPVVSQGQGGATRPPAGENKNAPESAPQQGNTPSTADASKTHNRLSSYNVAVVLPFLTDRFDANAAHFSGVTLWSIGFYGGLSLALEELQTQGHALQVTALDSKGTDAAFSKILRENQELAKAHLIIGPYRRVNIQQLSEYAKERKIPMISPYSAAANLTVENPYYIQVRPSLETHCRSAIRHALDHYRPAHIVLVGKDTPLEQQSLRFLQEGYYTWAGSRLGTPLTEYKLSGTAAQDEDVQLSPYLVGRDTAVFIVPAWSPEDEAFVYTLLRKLELERRPGQHVVVYGTAQWMDYEKIDLDYYEKSNLHISSQVYIDNLNPAVQAFRSRYFQRYGALPGEEAYLGYDVMHYFARMLKEYGTQFQDDLEKAPGAGLHTRFDFERIAYPATGRAELAPVQQYENKYVHLLQFKNYQFQLPD